MPNSTCVFGSTFSMLERLIWPVVNALSGRTQDQRADR